MFYRIQTLSTDYSFFLFGPRGCGKSTLIKKILPESRTRIFDLLNFDLEQRLLSNPAEFRQLLSALPPEITWVVVDEVQKIPGLLNEVHAHLESHPARYFALTGSSARKLKRDDNVNLLGGRAFTFHLHPLTTWELGDKFVLDEILRFGSLPKVVSLNGDTAKKRFLRSYAQTYLQQEIQMEAVTRNLTAFRKFLPLAAASNGQILSWSNFARDVGVDNKTIQSWFGILEDTLLGFQLSAYNKSLRQRQVTHPKFYLFDTGVKRALCHELNLQLAPGQSEYGHAFEHFIILELKRLNDYHETDFTFSYFATHDMEIDLVIERPGKKTLLVEIKSASRVPDVVLRGLAGLARDTKNAEALCIANEPRRRKVGDITVYPWREAVGEIFPA